MLFRAAERTVEEAATTQFAIVDRDTDKKTRTYRRAGSVLQRPGTRSYGFVAIVGATTPAASAGAAGTLLGRPLPGLTASTSAPSSATRPRPRSSCRRSLKLTDDVKALRRPRWIIEKPEAARSSTLQPKKQDFGRPLRRHAQHHPPAGLAVGRCLPRGWRRSMGRLGRLASCPGHGLHRRWPTVRRIPFWKWARPMRSLRILHPVRPTTRASSTINPAREASAFRSTCEWARTQRPDG